MSRRRPHTVTCTALVIASAVAGASCISAAEPTSERLGAASAEIIGGDADTTDTAIVALSDVSNGSLCSGTLIAPSLVLTAAHCVDGVAASNLRVLLGNDTTNPDQTVMVTSAVPYPSYTSEANGIPGGVDLGFVTLATPLTMTPIAVSTTTPDAELTNADVTVIGYGVNDGTDNTGGGTRRSVVLQVSEVCSRFIQAGNATVNACVGDSGGAVLLGGKLVAVVSGGSQGCESPTYFQRTDAHADWIASILAGTEESDATTCATCVQPDPSCTAATETEPAGAGEDAGPLADDSGEDSGGKKVAGGGGGGCQVARGEPGGGAFAGTLGILALSSLARRRRRRPR